MSVGTVDVQLSEIKRGRSVVRVPFQATWLEWSLVMQEIGVRILSDHKAFPLRITSTLTRCNLAVLAKSCG